MSVAQCLSHPLQPFLPHRWRPPYPGTGVNSGCSHHYHAMYPNHHQATPLVTRRRWNSSHDRSVTNAASKGLSSPRWAATGSNFGWPGFPVAKLSGRGVLSRVSARPCLSCTGVSASNRASATNSGHRYHRLRRALDKAALAISRSNCTYDRWMLWWISCTRPVWCWHTGTGKTCSCAHSA